MVSTILQVTGDHKAACRLPCDVEDAIEPLQIRVVAELQMVEELEEVG